MDKYPYPEIYSRNDNIFFKTISPTSPNYEITKEKLEREIRATPNMFLRSSISKIFSNYNFLNLFAIPEHPYEVELTVDITPKTENREDVNIDMGEVKLNIPTPASLPSDAVEPIKPTVDIASFSPVAPSVVIPELHTPPTLVFLAYPDCNFCERLLFSDANTIFGTNYRKDFYRLHNTWYDDRSYPKEELMFKTSYISSSGTIIDSFNKTNVEDRDNIIKVDSYNPPKHYFIQKGLTAPRYTQENMSNSASKISDATELAKARNRQSFLVGGGRAIEFDSNGGYLLPGITIEMGGPLVFGIAKQDDSYNAFNYGTITDKTEKDDDYLKYLTFDDDGYLTRVGADGVKGIVVSNDARLPDITWHNQGNIDLVGQLSVAIYTYGDGQQQVINDGIITIADSNLGADIKNVGIYAKNNNIKLKNTKDINVGKITINAANGIGIFLGKGAEGENTINGIITINPDAIGAKGIYLTDDGTLVENSNTKSSTIVGAPKDAVSVVPNTGVKAKYNIPLGTSKIVTSMDVNLSKELGNMDDGDMKARVNRTEAGYYSLVKDKKDNATIGVVGRIGVENESYGVALKAGHSSANKAINGGLEFRVKF